MKSLKPMKYLCSLLLGLLLLACSKPADEFLGTWSNNGRNENGKGGITISIYADGNNLLVKQQFMDTGIILSTHLGRVEGGYLLVEGAPVFDKFLYSKTDDALISTNAIQVIFKRVK